MFYLLGFEKHCLDSGLIFLVLATMVVIKGWSFIYIAWGYMNPQASITRWLPLPLHTIYIGIRFTCGHRRMRVLLYL
jgi:hypothetical protein